MITNRRTGRSTRIIDEAIQYLFQNGTVDVLDHSIPDSTFELTYKLSKRLTHIILDRLSHEHNLNSKEHLKVYRVPKGNIMRIELKDFLNIKDSDFEKWLNKKENKTLCGLPTTYVLDLYKETLKAKSK